MKSHFEQERLDEMFYWVREREKARQNKEAGKLKPWSLDPIIQTVRFCNIRRMDDKVSKWLIEHWYLPNVPQKQLLANAAMARLINWPDSLSIMAKHKLNKKWNKEKAGPVLREIRASGKLFTGAYIINGLSGQDKVTTVIDQFQEAYEHPFLVDPSSMERTHKQLQQLSGIGSFISGQIVADLRHVWEGSWVDKLSWAPLGPGSRRGIAWLLGWDGIEQLKSLPVEEFQMYMAGLMQEFKRRVPKIFAERQLEMHDLQNCLCETDKFLRIKHSTGRGKNGFAGT